MRFVEERPIRIWDTPYEYDCAFAEEEDVVGTTRKKMTANRGFVAVVAVIGISLCEHVSTPTKNVMIPNTEQALRHHSSGE
jgi:hypothetical protein